MMDSQKFCLKWDGFHGSVTSLFDQLRQEDELVDVTLCCEGRRVRAHRMMLSACSPYFRELLKSTPCQHLAIFLKDTSAADLSAIVEFMYRGSVNVSQSQLASFIKTAEMLQVKGLSGGEEEKPAPSPSPPPARHSGPPGRMTPPPAKRPRPTPGEPPPGGRAGGGAGSEGGSDLSAASPMASPEGRAEGSRQSGGAAGLDGVKVEKVDISDEDASLDATIGYVADYEATPPSGRTNREAAGLAGDPLGSLAAVQDGRMARDTAAAAAAVMALAAGPSQPMQSYGLNSQGKKKYSCDICGKQYNYRDSVYRHKRTHEGKTGCFVCGKVLSCLPTLREHMRFQHGMSAEEVACLVTARGAVSSPMALPVTSLAASVTSLGSGSATVESGDGVPVPARVNNVPLVTEGTSSMAPLLPSQLPIPASNAAPALWRRTAVAAAAQAVPGSVPPPRPGE